MPIDVGSAAAATSSLKTALEMAKGLVGLRDEAKLQATVVELTQAIIEAQQSALDAQQNEAALNEEIRGLKQQIAEFDEWTKTASAYEMVQLHPGSVAYVHTDAADKLSADHYLCPTCFAQRQAIPLQGDTATTYGRRFISCPVCKTEVIHSDAGRQPTVYSTPMDDVF